MLIAGLWRSGDTTYTVADPYSGEIVARAAQSTLQDMDDALTAAVAAKATTASMPGYERANLLRRVAALLTERADTLAEIITRETGKAISDSRAEVARSQGTLSLSAEEAVRIEGSHVPLESTPAGSGKIAVQLRFPVGVVAAITPFNAPLNLACHKVAPAIAAGNTIVLKAAPQAPCTAFKLAELFVDAGAAPGLINVLYGATVGPPLVRDARVDFVSFTGSSRVGAEIKATSGLKRVALELGGTGTTIVHTDADIPEAAAACARNAMRLAGQSCISVQNVYAHESIYDELVARLVAHVRTLKLGDPLEADTNVGTLIDVAAAKRVEHWVDEAVNQGARILIGGSRHGAQYEPTVLVETTQEMRVVCEEVFGPVVTVQRYRELEPIFERVSSGPYGLQCGVFTRSLEIALRAARSLRVGGVIINGTSTWRSDQMPYGGVKASGIGREGPRYAIRDMTEERLVLFNL